jgi:hypothetical protein
MGFIVLDGPRPDVIRFTIDRTVPFPRDSVFAWWVDFREDDHRQPGSPARSTRLILKRTENEIWLRDRATRPIPVTIDEHVILDPPNGYAVEARYPGADIRYAYRFDPQDTGTRVTLEAEVNPRGLGRILVPLTAAWSRRYAARDLDFHLQHMTHEFEGQGDNP